MKEYGRYRQNRKIEGHRAYRVDSPEGRYIQKQMGEESRRDDG